MKRIRFNQGWEFTLDKKIDEFSTFGFDKYSDASGACSRFYDNNNWQKVDLPHDWALDLEKNHVANTFAGAYPNTRYHRFTEYRHSDVDEVYNVGWYRKQFVLDPAWEGKRIFIEFEGVFRDAIVWVNGVYLDRHNSGYTTFCIEITDHILCGEQNSVAVRVDSEHAEGWWYEGSGIYRNVNLIIGEPSYFKYNQTVVRADIDGTVDVSAILVNDTESFIHRNVVFTIVDKEGKKVARDQKPVSLDAFSEKKISLSMRIDSPILWSVDSPYLYTLKISADEEKEVVRFGVRSVAFDPDKGFFLNDKPLKLRGACVHQDFGGVGVALSDNLQYYKIKRLKDMGVNAYRCSHNAPSPVLLDACDELGMLVMDETRAFGTSPEAIRQLTSLIERDRNHPSVFIWSLGNEEFSVESEPWSYRLMKKASRIAKSLDPTRPITYGGDNGPDFKGANGASEVRGVNYIRNAKDGKEQGGAWLDNYHKDHPTQPIVGTEESSYVLSRGGAVNNLEGLMLDSSGDVTMPWGSTLKGWVKYMEIRDYFSGGFMWTGFDYRGEPNPFQYQNCVSSFGTIDLCGMEKPPFYYYKSWWTNEPVLKIFPHWNHKPGDIVDVFVFTNCEEITLSLNGRVLETRRIERFDAPIFKVHYEPGVLSVTGKHNGDELFDRIVTTGDTANVTCTSVLDINSADDIGIYELNAYDSDGNLVQLADGTVDISVENGEIVGVGNGDPSNMEYERKPYEEKILPITSFETKEGIYYIPEKKGNVKPIRIDTLELEPKQKCYEDDYRLVVMTATSLPKNKETEFTAVISDVADYEYIEFERLGGMAKVYLNGELLGDNIKWYGYQSRTSNRPYRFYCKFKEGENRLSVVCQYGDDDLPLISGTVKLGAVKKTPWQVKLHYGKARVFVKSSTPDLLKINVNRK